MQKQAGDRLRQLRHSRFNSSRGAIQHPQILQTDTLSHIRFPCSEKRFRALASAVSWSASPKDAATFKPDSTYLSSERWRNRQFQCFFCWKCLVIAMSRYCSNSLPLAARSVPMVDNPEIEPEVELNLPLSPDYPITYVSLID